ncbi:hypothetical protein ACJMK2_003130 [Sinanodonta woodiana]|uniref:TGF-beta family profile domain-containing protein n=1 Tax=Sinanodonta woodiana TaxID=1069815 RepID=A0ABD3XXD0_SINWO
MWTIMPCLICTITMTTGIFSQSILNATENGLNNTIVNNALHGNTKTEGPVYFTLDEISYRDGAYTVEKYKTSLKERQNKIHRNGTYRTPQGEAIRHIQQHAEAHVTVNQGNVFARLAKRQVPSQLCQRHPLSVNFRSIGWVWIHKPIEYNKFVCRGECGNTIVGGSTPLYTQVQALVNIFQPSNNRPLCCVPTKTSSLDVEYYVGRNKNTLNMPDIIVEECGCR